MPTPKEVLRRTTSLQTNIAAFRLALPLIGWVYFFKFFLTTLGEILVLSENRAKDLFLLVLFGLVYFLTPLLPWLAFGKDGHAAALTLAFFLEFFICRYFFLFFIKSTVNNEMKLRQNISNRE